MQAANLFRLKMKLVAGSKLCQIGFISHKTKTFQMYIFLLQISKPKHTTTLL